MTGTKRVGTELRAAALALVAGLAAALLLLAWSPTTAPASATCRHADAHAHEISLPTLRRTVTCLINHKRSKHGRAALGPNGDLLEAAQDHNDVMLSKECFRHDCPGEPGLGHRIRRSGYTKHRSVWRYAEDLGYDETARKMVRAWLHSPVNRGHLLDPNFRDIGVGVGWGAPKRRLDDSKLATYTIVFGLRRR